MCDWRYLPPDCAVPFYAPHLASWLVFRYSAMSVHGGLTALGLLGFWAKYRIHQRKALAHSAGIVSVSSTQHVSGLLVRCLALQSRVVWSASSESPVVVCPGQVHGTR